MRKQKKHGIFSNIMFAMGWQFKVAPLFTLITFGQTIIGDIITDLFCIEALLLQSICFQKHRIGNTSLT